jgi:hypothetical protein
MRWLSYTFQISMIVICLSSSTRLARAQDQPSSPPAKPAPSDEKPADVAGTWSVSTETPNGTFTQTLTLKQNGATLSGTIGGEKATSDLTGTVNGNTVNFSFTRKGQRGTMTMNYSGTADGDTIKGTIKPSFAGGGGGRGYGGNGGAGSGGGARAGRGGGRGTHTFTATRQKQAS